MELDEERLQGGVLVARHVTVYRQWSFVRRWVEDVQLREPKVEWFLYNDAPDDPCPPDLMHLLREMRVTVTEGRFNLGRSTARNELVRKSTAPFLEFIDGDDIPMALGSLGDLTTDADVLSFPIQTYRIKTSEVEFGAVERSPGFACPGLFRSLSEVSPLPASLLYRRTLFEECGGFDGRFDTIEDLHLLWKLDKLGALVKFSDRPKQRYFMTNTAGRCDGDIRPLHWVRFFRHAEAFAQREDGGSGAVPRFVETSEINTVETLLRDLARHLPRTLEREAVGPPVQALIKTLETDATLLYWQAASLFCAARRPSFFVRLREALKMVFRRYDP